MKTAIVTTYRGAAPLLDSFLAYHLALGFDHVFLFSDDPEDAGTEIARRYPAATVVPGGEELHARWRRTALYRSRTKWVETHLHREVMVRQMLNVEVAIEMARESGVDWLLHIDVDELFHCPDTTVAEHFVGLAEQGLAGVKYLNYEGVPESADVVDCFREVTLFKVPPRTLPGGGSPEAQREAMSSIFPGSFFHFYANGKSAARVAPGLRPASVHAFTPTVRLQRLYFVQQHLAGTGPVRWLRQRGLAAGLRRLLLREGVFPVALRSTPAILHYPCCTWEVFWDKYRVLGRFGNAWFGEVDIRRAVGGTHLDSRDVVMQGDPDRAREFYRERFVMPQEHAARLLECGLAVRIHGPAELLSGLRPASPAGGDALLSA